MKIKKERDEMKRGEIKEYELHLCFNSFVYLYRCRRHALEREQARYFSDESDDGS